jgi:hypothetical protein
LEAEEVEEGEEGLDLPVEREQYRVLNKLRQFENNFVGAGLTLESLSS